MYKMNRAVKQIVVMSGLLASLAALQGCVAVALGGAVVGTVAATDRRTLGAQTEDKAITLKGESAMRKAFGSGAHINVTSFNRRALLTGEVLNEADKERAEKEMRAVENVVQVQNELVVSGLSSLSSQSSDALTTTKVRAALLNTKSLDSNALKVVTEAGTVFLMGRVTEEEGSIAASMTAMTSGVRKVVKVFEYITEEQRQQFVSKSSKVDLSEKSETK